MFEKQNNYYYVFGMMDLDVQSLIIANETLWCNKCMKILVNMAYIEFIKCYVINTSGENVLISSHLWWYLWGLQYGSVYFQIYNFPNYSFCL